MASQSLPVTGNFSSGGGAAGFAAAPPVGGDLLPRFNLIDQLFIIRALILRQIRISYRKTRVGFMLVFLQPASIMCLHIFLLELWAEVSGQTPAANIPIELFIINGFTVWFIFSHTGHGPKHSVGDGPGATLMPLVTTMHFRIAAATWEFLAMTSLCFSGVILSEMIHGNEPVPNVPAAVLVYADAAFLGFGTRLVLDACSERWPVIRHMEKLLFRMLFIMSAIFYSAINLHKALGDWPLYNPVIHLVELGRNALYPGYPIFEVSLLYPTLWAFGLTFVGLILNRCARRWKIV
jgi:capsular polysaccharide transport system permease protein